MSDEQLGTLLVRMAKITHELSDKNLLKRLNGDTLSYTAVKLAALKASIIDFKVTAHQVMLDKEIEADRQKAIAYKKAMKDSNATAAKDGKYDDETYIKARQEYATAKVQFEKLKSMAADAHDVIESIRSRVIDLQSQRKDEQVK